MVGAEAKRAKTVRGRRALARREPKLVENPRTALILRGQKSCALVNSALTDLYLLKKPHAVHFRSVGDGFLFSTCPLSAKLLCSVRSL